MRRRQYQDTRVVALAAIKSRGDIPPKELTGPYLLRDLVMPLILWVH